MKKFKHTNADLEMARIRTEREKNSHDKKNVITATDGGDAVVDADAQDSDADSDTAR